MGTLLERTVRLMDELDLPTGQIREVCNRVGVTPRWYHNVKTGKTKHPSVNRIETLYQELSMIKEAA